MGRGCCGGSWRGRTLLKPWRHHEVTHQFLDIAAKNGNFSPTVDEGGEEREKKREKRRRKRGKVVKGV